MSTQHKLLPSCLIPEVYSPWQTQPGFVARQIERIAKEGFYRSIEISRVLEATDRAAIRSICAEHGLYVSMWLTAMLEANGLDLTSVDESLRQRSAEAIKQALPEAAACGARTISLVGGSDPGPDLRRRGYDSCYASLMEICAAASGLGMTVMFEPLDRFAHKKRLVGPADEAVEVFERVRATYPDFGFAFDTAHTELNEEDIEASLALAKAQVANVHLSNAVLDKASPLYGDHHMMPGAPGFLTVERAAAIVAAVVRLGIAPERGLPVAVEARARPTDGEQSTADIAEDFLKAVFAKAGIATGAGA